MVKKILEIIKNIINIIILLIKKIHFFHIWFIMLLPYSLIAIMVSLYSVIFIPTARVSRAIENYLANYTYIELFTFIIAIHLSIIAVVIQLISTRKLFVTDKTLLYNKVYNIYYILSFICIIAINKFIGNNY